jgi:hypothetical protein
MDAAQSTQPYDASQDDTFLISETDTYLKDQWKRALATGDERARFGVGQALAHLAGLSCGRFGMTAAELEESLQAVSQ